MNFTELVQMQDGTEYEIKTRVSWSDFMRVDHAGERMLFVLNGETFNSLDDLKSATQDFDGEIKAEMVYNEQEKTRLRLETRLVGMSKAQISRLPLLHVVQLIARIVELENEEKAKIAEVTNPQNPTTSPSLI